MAADSLCFSVRACAAAPATATGFLHQLPICSSPFASQSVYFAFRFCFRFHLCFSPCFSSVLFGYICFCVSPVASNLRLALRFACSSPFASQSVYFAFRFCFRFHLCFSSCFSNVVFGYICFCVPPVASYLRLALRVAAHVGLFGCSFAFVSVSTSGLSSGFCINFGLLLKTDWEPVARVKARIEPKRPAHALNDMPAS